MTGGQWEEVLVAVTAVAFDVLVNLVDGGIKRVGRIRTVCDVRQRLFEYLCLHDVSQCDGANERLCFGQTVDAPSA